MSLDDKTETLDQNSDALAPGSKLLSGQYEVLRYLSSGGFGITYLAKDSLNRTVVIKECFPEAFCNRVNKTVRARTQNYLEDFRSIVKLFIREAHALSRLDHPSVVGVHQVFEDNETAYMALDLIDGSDLLDVIENGAHSLSPVDIKSIAIKLLDAIAHVHAQDLLHRDISPDNILVDKNKHPVLIDFGAAREEASRKSRVLSSLLVVKDGYSPQEFYVAGSQQSPCSDLYALGATLSHLISGKAPPNSQARLAALAGNQPDLYEPLLGRFPAYDDAFLEAIDAAMQIIPAERLQTAEEWRLRIDHQKRAELAKARARDDKSIDQTVIRLVETAKAQSDLPENATSARNGVPSEPDAAGGSNGAAAQADSVASDTDLLTAEIPDEPHAPAAAGPDSDAAGDGRPSQDDAAQNPTPYVRVITRAEEKAKHPKPPPKSSWSPRRIIRYATVPIVFCAYFFYAYTLLQFEEVQAATLQPLLAFSESFGGWNQQGSSDVTVRRGIGG